MSQLRLALLAVAAAACALLSASVARADAFVNLSGENVDGVTVDPAATSVNCEDGTGTIRYRVFGTATGPYPGTFEETGTITVQNSLIVGFHATFEIDSATAEIHGTKSLSRNAIILCGPDPEGEVPGVFGAGNLIARYDATITSVLGTYEDRGVAPTAFDVTEHPSGLVTGGVHERFDSDRENASFSVEPIQSVNAVGTTHTVTALITDAVGDALQGEHVLFVVAGSTTTTGTCTTNAMGFCDFTYAGPAVPGIDAITACYDFDRSGAPDPGERCVEASKVWIQPVPGAGGVSGGGYIGMVSGEQIAFGLAAEPTGALVYRGSCSVVDHATDTHVRCLDVTQLVVVGRHATIFGQAEVNGIATNYQIDVHDVTDEDEGDTFVIHTDNGYTAGGVVTNGNIRVASG